MAMFAEDSEKPEVMLDTPKANVETHKFSDIDLTPRSGHHSLGPGPNQAAAGNHKHALLLAEIATIKARLAAAGIP
jgi:hypothetical protein